MNRISPLLPALALLIFVQVPTCWAGQKSSAGRHTVPVDDSYRIGVEDELRISVWREPDLTSQVVVRPDGMITLPLINDFFVNGLTTRKLQKMLTDRLKEFVTEPQVTVTLQAIRSRKVYLIGQVARPGAFPLDGSQTLLEILVQAGGLTPFAKASSIYTLRNNNNYQERLPYSYKKALKGDTQDFRLEPGDIVVVP